MCLKKWLLEIIMIDNSKIAVKDDRHNNSNRQQKIADENNKLLKIIIYSLKIKK